MWGANRYLRLRLFVDVQVFRYYGALLASGVKFSPSYRTHMSGPILANQSNRFGLFPVSYIKVRYPYFESIKCTHGSNC